jgi:hypothetical protein
MPSQENSPDQFARGSLNVNGSTHSSVRFTQFGWHGLRLKRFMSRAFSRWCVIGPGSWGGARRLV